MFEFEFSLERERLTRRGGDCTHGVGCVIWVSLYPKFKHCKGVIVVVS